MNTTIFFVLAIPNLLVKLLTFNLLYWRTKQIKKDSRLSGPPCYLCVCVSVSNFEPHGRFLRNMVWALRHRTPQHIFKFYTNSNNKREVWRNCRKRTPVPPLP